MTVKYTALGLTGNYMPKFYIDFSKNLDFDFAVIGEIRWWGRVAR